MYNIQIIKMLIKDKNNLKEIMEFFNKPKDVDEEIEKLLEHLYEDNKICVCKDFLETHYLRRESKGYIFRSPNGFGLDGYHSSIIKALAYPQRNNWTVIYST